MCVKSCETGFAEWRRESSQVAPKETGVKKQGSGYSFRIVTGTANKLVATRNAESARA